MKFGVLYEHQIPRPWADGKEEQIYHEALDQVEFADSIDFSYAWEVEHHFLEEYSHSSAPEVFLAAASQRTKQIRLGHGIVLMPPGYNHPARVAERIATLDLVSRGRVEFGTGESSSRMELGGFNVKPMQKREQWTECVRECCRMMSMEPYPGYEGKYLSMPERNVIPKPVQKPHPPVWVACSNRQTIHLAAQLGLGALTFSFVEPDDARYWVEDYYATFKKECTPLTNVINPNICLVSSFSCHHDEETAVARGMEGFRFFSYALGYYYAFGKHNPGRSNIWDEFMAKEQPKGRVGAGSGGIGTPDQLRAHLKKYEDIGVDQITFIQQAGNNKHEHIIDSLQLFHDEVQGEFQEKENEREKRKMEELAPYIEDAWKRKRNKEEEEGVAPLGEGSEVAAYGRAVAEGT